MIPPKTPFFDLHLISQTDNLEVVTILLAHGAEENDEDEDNDNYN